jgi:DNA-binding beta-propeller fold protein YncE
MTLRPRLVAMLLVTALMTGVNAQSRTDRPTWPPAPAPARIRFIRTLNPAAVRGRPSVFSRFVAVITGGSPEPTMSQPYGIAVGPDRRVYVADTFGGAIHVYNVEKSAYTTIRVDARSLIGIGLIGNRIVVTDSASGRVLCLDAKGRTIWTLGPKNGFERPTGLVTTSDRLYVVDTMKHRVVVVGAAGDIISTFGTRGAGPGQFNFPTNIARGADGRLFVTDTMNFRVQVFDADGRPLNAFGRLGDGLGDFDKPKGVAVDSAGHIYVVEGLNDVVQIFDADGRLLLAFGGSGAGDGQLWLPSGIAIANDVVYVADSANRRVEVFEYVREPR